MCSTHTRVTWHPQDFVQFLFSKARVVSAMIQVCLCQDLMLPVVLAMFVQRYAFRHNACPMRGAWQLKRYHSQCRIYWLGVLQFNFGLRCDKHTYGMCPTTTSYSCLALFGHVPPRCRCLGALKVDEWRSSAASSQMILCPTRARRRKRPWKRP